MMENTNYVSNIDTPSVSNCCTNPYTAGPAPYTTGSTITFGSCAYPRDMTTDEMLNKLLTEAMKLRKCYRKLAKDHILELGLLFNTKSKDES